MTILERREAIKKILLKYHTPKVLVYADECVNKIMRIMDRP